MNVNIEKTKKYIKEQINFNDKNIKESFLTNYFKEKQNKNKFKHLQLIYLIIYEQWEKNKPLINSYITHEFLKKFLEKILDKTIRSNATNDYVKVLRDSKYIQISGKQNKITNITKVFPLPQNRSDICTALQNNYSEFYDLFCQLKKSLVPIQSTGMMFQQLGNNQKRTLQAEENENKNTEVPLSKKPKITVVTETHIETTQLTVSENSSLESSTTTQNEIIKGF